MDEVTVTLVQAYSSHLENVVLQHPSCLFPYLFLSKSLSDSNGKASVYNAGDPGSIPGLGRSPGEGNWQSTPGLLPGKSHGQRSLVGYSPWHLKESDTTE